MTIFVFRDSIESIQQNPPFLFPNQLKLNLEEKIRVIREYLYLAENYCDHPKFRSVC